MDGATVTFLGSGDAFGSGGRFQTCIQVEAGDACFLMDCGASSLIAMRRFGADPNAIATIVVSHLHGDHFGGVPFFVLDAQLISKRQAPLTVAGPPGTGARLAEAMEALFPGSTQVQRKFELNIVELQPGRPHDLGGPRVTPQEVEHPCGAPPLALRVECGGRVITYTGDSQWCAGLLEAGREADLLIAEAYTAERPIRFHLDLATLRRHLPEMRPRRVILTHMSSDMLRQAGDCGFQCAEDGLRLEI